MTPVLNIRPPAKTLMMSHSALQWKILVFVTSYQCDDKSRSGLTEEFSSNRNNDKMCFSFLFNQCIRQVLPY